jgi:hypothetical protein
MAASDLVVIIGVPVVGAGLIATGLIVWLRGRIRAARARLAAELAAEPAVRGPESGIYRGSTGGYSNVFGNGQIALTARRLLFQKTVGSLVAVDLANVTGVRTDKVFNRSVVGGRVHVIVQTHTGDVGYFVNDTDAWKQAIERAVAT